MPERATSVLLMGEIEMRNLVAVFDGRRIEFVHIDDAEPIPGSYWGEPEAGLIGDSVYYRGDTPVHSVLHEACHSVCIPADRRQNLHTDAGGDYDEENAVCYLQILLAAKIDKLGADRIMDDMDAWGYTFRLGSARAWYTRDADDACSWLLARRIIEV